MRRIFGQFENRGLDTTTRFCFFSRGKDLLTWHQLGNHSGYIYADILKEAHLLLNGHGRFFAQLTVYFSAEHIVYEFEGLLACESLAGRSSTWWRQGRTNISHEETDASYRLESIFQRDSTSVYSRITDKISKISKVFQFDSDLFISKVSDRVL